MLKSGFLWMPLAVGGAAAAFSLPAMARQETSLDSPGRNVAIRMTLAGAGGLEGPRWSAAYLGTMRLQD